MPRESKRSLRKRTLHYYLLLYSTLSNRTIFQDVAEKPRDATCHLKIVLVHSVTFNNNKSVVFMAGAARSQTPMSVIYRHSRKGGVFYNGRYISVTRIMHWKNAICIDLHPQSGPRRTNIHRYIDWDRVTENNSCRAVNGGRLGVNMPKFLNPYAPKF